MTTPASRVTAEKSEAVGHTPGEWTGEVFEDGAFVIQGPDGAVLCQRNSWPTRAAESRSNGSLMMAAPKMLEALKQALTHIEVDETTHGRNFAAGNVVRAAIRKAQGRAS